jgi:hypothetical protein
LSERLPAHLEAAALIRQTQAGGGFATVLQKGEKEAGTILLVLCENDTNARVYERMPALDGARKWTLSKSQDNENKAEFSEYLTRRGARKLVPSLRSLTAAPLAVGHTPPLGRQDHIRLRQPRFGEAVTHELDLNAPGHRAARRPDRDTRPPPQQSPRSTTRH